MLKRKIIIKNCHLKIRHPYVYGESERDRLCRIIGKVSPVCLIYYAACPGNLGSNIRETIDYDVFKIIIFNVG